MLVAIRGVACPHEKIMFLSPQIMRCIFVPCYVSMSYLQYHLGAATNSWSPGGSNITVEAGQLGKIVAILSSNSASQQHLTAALDRGLTAHTTHAMPIQDIVVLARVGSGNGHVVQIPVMHSEVKIIRPHGIVDIGVSYLPIRLGWCTTVTASQGLEFERVLLDLDGGGWLAGGAYSSIGRVKGDLRTGLKIMGCFSRGIDAFKVNPDARKWFASTVLAQTQR